jgi:ribose transport system permease protein
MVMMKMSIRKSDTSEVRSVAATAKTYLKKIDIIIIPIFCLFLIFTIIQPRFATLENFLTVLRQGSFLAIASCGQMIVILTAGLDLSIGSVVALSGVIATTTAIQNGTMLGYLTGTLTGCFIGAINGIVVALAGVPPFIVTLSMMSIAGGVALTITGGRTVSGLPDNFSIAAAGYIAGIPIPVIVAALILLLTWIFLNQTRYGRELYAIGGNVEAARLSGISIKNRLILAYTVCGLLSGVAGVLLASRANSGPPTLGGQMTLSSVAAICIGGVSLFGGIGKVSGVFWGVFLLSLLSNGFDLINVSSYNQMIIIGTVIVLAVALNVYKKT